MKKFFRIFLSICCVFQIALAQDSISAYKKTSARIPMRDGVKLYTVILSPVDAKKPFPFLIQRTPYGSDPGWPDDSTFRVDMMGSYLPMAKEGYIFIFQDIRG